MTDHDDLRAHCRNLLQRIDANGNRCDYPAQLIAENTDRLRRLYGDDTAGAPLTAAETMKLGIALHIWWLRDRAWADITVDKAQERAEQWMYVATTLPPVFVTPAAFLAAFAASSAGDFLGARAALEVALTCDPHYGAALLLLSDVVHEVLPLRMDDAVGLLTSAPAAEWLQPLRDRIHLFHQIDGLPSQN